MKTVFIAAAIAVFWNVTAFAQMPMPQDSPTSSAPYGPPIDDEQVWTHATLDQFEGRFGRDNNLRWDGEAWVGTDSDRVWLKTEGELATHGVVEDGQQELLYDRPITTFFDLQAGIRYDLDSRPGGGWLALGVEGLGQYFTHVSATAYASSNGHFAAKLTGSYDLLLTQQLILQPQLEMNLYSKSDSARLTGSGLSDIDTGLRLRYEVTRKFAPYVGITYAKKFAQTRSYAHVAGNPTDDLSFTIGSRLWF